MPAPCPLCAERPGSGGQPSDSQSTLDQQQRTHIFFGGTPLRHCTRAHARARVRRHTLTTRPRAHACIRTHVRSRTLVNHQQLVSVYAANVSRSGIRMCTLQYHPLMQADLYIGQILFLSRVPYSSPFFKDGPPKRMNILSQYPFSNALRTETSIKVRSFIKVYILYIGYILYFGPTLYKSLRCTSFI